MAETMVTTSTGRRAPHGVSGAIERARRCEDATPQFAASDFDDEIAALQVWWACPDPDFAAVRPMPARILDVHRDDKGRVYSLSVDVEPRGGDPIRVEAWRIEGRPFFCGQVRSAGRRTDLVVVVPAWENGEWPAAWNALLRLDGRAWQGPVHPLTRATRHELSAMVREASFASTPDPRWGGVVGHAMSRDEATEELLIDGRWLRTSFGAELCLRNRPPVSEWSTEVSWPW